MTLSEHAHEAAMKEVAEFERLGLLVPEGAVTWFKMGFHTGGALGMKLLLERREIERDLAAMVKAEEQRG